MTPTLIRHLSPATPAAAGDSPRNLIHVSAPDRSIDGNEKEMQFDERQLRILKQVQVSLPWRSLRQYWNLVMELRMNLEIGLAAKELDQVPQPEFKAVAEQLQKAECRITLHAPFWDLSPGSSDPLIRRATLHRFEQLLDLADVFQPLHLVFHTGYDPRHHGTDPVPFLERSLSVWEPVVERAAGLGIAVLLENVWEYDPGFHEELLGRLSSPWFGFCLDTGHQHSFSRTGLSRWIAALSDELREVHLHDNHGMEDEHLPIGHGTIDFPLLLDELDRYRLKPLVTLEPHRKEHLLATLTGLDQLMEGRTPPIRVAGHAPKTP